MKKGKVWKYGDDINTDVIFPGKYTYSVLEPEEMARHALEDLDPEFAPNVKKGDIIVAGKNFGCGSSREQAATCLKFAGVRAVVAKSFARIFFRNAVNQGLPVIQCSGVVDIVRKGDEIGIDEARGIIEIPQGELGFIPFPEYLIRILDAGGLIPFIKKKLEKEKHRN